MVLPKLNTILLDLDNTLIDRSLAVKRYFSHLLRSADSRLSHANLKKKLDDIIEQDQLGYSERTGFCDWVTTKHLQGWSGEKLWIDFSERMPHNIQPEPKCLALLDKLKAHYALGIITNGSSKNQRAKLQASNIDQHIDHLIISGEVGLEKPDPLIFQKAIQELSTSADQTLYVGDHPRNDVVGAINAGMQACWVSIDRKYPLDLQQPHYQIQSINSLPSLLL